MKKIKIEEPKWKITLHPYASLKRVLEEYETSLTLKHFDLIPESTFSLEKMLENPTTKIKIKSIELPLINQHNFLAYVEDFKRDMEQRINKLKRSKIPNRDKIKLLVGLINHCRWLELKYNPYNRMIVFFDFEWKINKTTVPFTRLDISKNHFAQLNDEIVLRHEFFQWLGHALESYKRQLEASTPVSDFLVWKKSENPEIKIAEIIYALELSEEIEYTSTQSRVDFLYELERLFNLKKVKWSALYADIRKRKRKPTLLDALVKSLEK